MLTDCHVHLSDSKLDNFRKSYRNGANTILRIFSNSIDLESSKQNLELGKIFPSVKAFVGIHPETFLHNPEISVEKVDEMCGEILVLAKESCGIGEIGLDPKYGNLNIQLKAFEQQLEIAESRPDLPISIHSRETMSECFELLSRYRIGNSVLFHWFSGTESDLNKAHSLGYYTSFGLPSLFSKRVRSLIGSLDSRFLLAETDSPVVFQSISNLEPVTPFALASVIFQMSLILGVSFDEMKEINENNANVYLKRKPH